MFSAAQNPAPSDPRPSLTINRDRSDRRLTTLPTFQPPVTPPPVPTGRLNHVALNTADPVRGAKFYREVLGFAETPRPSFSFRGSWLLHREVGVMIHLIHDEDFEPRLAGPINTRTHHLAMQVVDYDAAVQRLQLHNVQYVERVLPDYGYRQVFFRDPDGNVLELGEWPSPEEMFPQRTGEDST
jgi:catechol 2,3-dioxygenase-like lactoylglutathione lyase family enzyme